MNAAIRHDGVFRDLHAHNEHALSTKGRMDAEVERVSVPRHEPPVDEASRRSTALESAFHGAVGGGRGDDEIVSSGDNTIYTGRGSDSVDVREGNATVYGQFGFFDVWNRDSVTVHDGATAAREQVDLSLIPQDPPVNVEGSQEFQDRVESDLDFLEASPAGQQMFDEFRRTRADGNEVTITELQNERNGGADPQGDRGFIGEDSEGEGVDVVINYNTEHFKYGDDYHSPLITLYHEMSHAYNGVSG